MADEPPIDSECRPGRAHNYDHLPLGGEQQYCLYCDAPEPAIDPPSDSVADAIDHWRRQADGAWRTYIETGDPADRDDALTAAEHYHRWVDAIDDAIKDMTPP